MPGLDKTDSPAEVDEAAVEVGNIIKNEDSDPAADAEADVEVSYCQVALKDAEAGANAVCPILMETLFLDHEDARNKKKTSNKKKDLMALTVCNNRTRTGYSKYSF
jgi:hypothetical protein